MSKDTLTENDIVRAIDYIQKKSHAPDPLLVYIHSPYEPEWVLDAFRRAGWKLVEAERIMEEEEHGTS